MVKTQHKITGGNQWRGRDSEKSPPSFPPQSRPKLFLGTTQGGGQLLAPEPRSGDTLSPVDQLLRDYQCLHRTISEKAAMFASTVATARDAYWSLMPELDRMQRLLSQRGTERHQRLGLELPTWTQYLLILQMNMTNTQVNIRTIQRWLQAFRNPENRAVNRRTKLLKLSQADQRRLIRAAAVANDLVAAIEAGARYESLIAEWKALALTLDAIGKMAEDAVVHAVTEAG